MRRSASPRVPGSSTAAASSPRQLEQSPEPLRRRAVRERGAEQVAPDEQLEREVEDEDRRDRAERRGRAGLDDPRDEPAQHRRRDERDEAEAPEGAGRDVPAAGVGRWHRRPS